MFTLADLNLVPPGFRYIKHLVAETRFLCGFHRGTRSTVRGTMWPAFAGRQFPNKRKFLFISLNQFPPDGKYVSL